MTLIQLPEREQLDVAKPTESNLESKVNINNTAGLMWLGLCTTLTIGGGVYGAYFGYNQLENHPVTGLALGAIAGCLSPLLLTIPVYFKEYIQNLQDKKTKSLDI